MRSGRRDVRRGEARRGWFVALALVSHAMRYGMCARARGTSTGGVVYSTTSTILHTTLLEAGRQAGEICLAQKMPIGYTYVFGQSLVVVGFS